MYLDTVKMFAGNSTANLTANSIIVSVSNSTATSNLQPTQLVIGSSTVNTSAYFAGANVFLNTTTLSVGNSTANLLANSILISVANSTGTANLQPTQLILGSSIVNSTVITSGGSLLSANVQVNAQTGTTYTLAAGDSGKIVTMDNGSPMTVTVPAGLPIGFRCQVLRLGAGTCTLSNTGQTGCTILSRTSAFAITARYGSASVFQTATANTYICDGLL